MSFFRVCFYCRFLFISDLEERAESLVQAGWAPRTRSGYATAVRRYVSFASQHALHPLPLTETKVLCFAAYLEAQGLMSRTVKTYVSGLSAWVVSLGFPKPQLWTPRLHLVLRAMERKQRPPARPTPITFPLLQAMFDHLPLGVDGLVLGAAMALQYFGCLRASEFCMDPLDGSAPTLSSITFGTFEGRPIMRYVVSRSKTNVHGFQLHVGCSERPICALCVVHSFISIFPYHPSSWLFPTSTGSPLTYQMYNILLKQAAARAGLDPATISSHSLRAGAATQAAQAGFQGHEVQRLGRWRSQAFTTYMRPIPERDALLSARLT